ncbi:PfkB family carbohydrate kinase [Candidatus Nanopelagicales bacterium]|nr:PfkB family carbohydrate kinase [Candidatus Nanopelagicales bacterium]
MIVEQPRTVFVSGVFNILHPGHVRLLRFAGELGDRLVVGVLADRLTGDEVTIGESSRLEAIQSLRMVDDSFIIEGSVTDTIRRLRPDVVVKGREHVTRENEELAVLSTYGGRLVFSSGDSFFSSTDLIRNEVDGPRRLPVVLPVEFMAHHGITRERLSKILGSLSSVRVLVVGDCIVDEYVSCHPLGMSREDPTLVVTPIETKTFVGGAGIVAAHAASLGGRASLHTVTGVDSEAGFLANEASKFGFEAYLHADNSRPTTLKQRWRAGGKTLLRVSHLHQDPISNALAQELFEGVAESIDQCDVLIFSDFSYGALPQLLVDQLTELGKERGVTMAADSQASSQIGDISRFVGMNLITPTEYEARLATRNFEDGLVVLADQLRQKSKADLVLMTLAEDGVFIRGTMNPTAVATTERLPALNSTPVDVAGAGDALIVVASMALSVGATMHEAALLGSMAAALQVSTTGNRPIHPEALAEILTR